MNKDKYYFFYRKINCHLSHQTEYDFYDFYGSDFSIGNGLGIVYDFIVLKIQ